ncbi:unnamed protein product [Polarella glacialis]|uniref:PARP-type domain-containing protein n=1 Tax=Polarella glacialis TaxID=89957 RepID=A0A813HM64_POLGL|nr:unnamed protein product [Polarella glacialis]CAE8695790.1 unnamed protein product [Polarella glacialis]
MSSLASPLVSFEVEYAKSSRAKCRKCGDKIEKGSVRVGIKTDEHLYANVWSSWYQLTCLPSAQSPAWFAKHFTEEVAQSVRGLDGLSEEDRTATKRVLQAILDTAKGTRDSIPEQFSLEFGDEDISDQGDGVSVSLRCASSGIVTSFKINAIFCTMKSLRQRIGSELRLNEFQYECVIGEKRLMEYDDEIRLVTLLLELRTNSKACMDAGGEVSDIIAEPASKRLRTWTEAIEEIAVSSGRGCSYKLQGVVSGDSRCYWAGSPGGKDEAKVLQFDPQSGVADQVCAKHQIGAFGVMAPNHCLYFPESQTVWQSGMFCVDVITADVHKVTFVPKWACNGDAQARPHNTHPGPLSGSYSGGVLAKDGKI